MPDALVCWKCGAPIGDLPLPLSRYAECRQCRADLHVCRLCEFYDRRVAKDCREPIAEEVKDKERANYCDYFKIRPDAFAPQKTAEAEAAKAELRALFGVAPEETVDKQPSTMRDPRAEEEAARKKLESLFGIAPDEPETPN